MRTPEKIILAATMTAALLFGFLHLFVPGHDFERLHIFLFNLCAGGSVLVAFTEREKNLSVKAAAFYILSVAYALCAFFALYIQAVAIAVLLSLLVETVRAGRFRFLPFDFFSRSTPVSEKFHHAALLCLSIALSLSALVICNSEYWRLVAVPRLTLNIFFLGFSFPVSLATMSLMFGMMEGRGGRGARIVEESVFWTVTVGVIVFFTFILMRHLPAQMAAALALSLAVAAVFVLYLRRGRPLQSKAFLTSGAVFLVMTAITGVAYLAWYALVPEPPGGKPLLRLHALISLYGWNLSGLVVMCRSDDFPLRLNSTGVILFHWLVVAFIAPLGFYVRPVSIAAVGAFAILLVIVLFSKSPGTRQAAE